ncbi:hypothetical protein TrRE_jg4669 [Triparma retinervis]|uniref:HOOK N-terminal domain-containing protein n=1 Tax=Triparma retinervis TaxID=2557542 RepID=A0A9W7G4H9_9STRA|nr:hypothetical protein TrRE_jg4669 [Triparma retinervis]
MSSQHNENDLQNKLQNGQNQQQDQQQDTNSTTNALFEYIKSLPSNPDDVSQLKDLADGTALFTVMSKVSPDYFDPSTLTPTPGTNWPLRLSNLKKLVSNLTDYYTSELLMSPSILPSIQLDQIAKSEDPKHLSDLISVIVLALISCPDKATYIQPIMQLSPSSQSALKLVIETTMSTVTKLELQRRESLESEGEEVDFDSPPPSSAELLSLQDKVASLTASLALTKTDLAAAELARDDGRAEEAERHNEKLQALVKDLQSRLEEKEGEAAAKEGELRALKADHEELTEEHGTVRATLKGQQDELEILRAKSLQLTKSEAQLQKAKSKIEEMEPVVVRMGELERKGGEDLDKILKLEEETKQVPVLQKRADAAKASQIAAEKAAHDAETKLKAKVTQVEQLKSQLQTASTTSKMFETELSNLKATRSDSVDSPPPPTDLLSPAQSAETKEKITRLEFENSSLKNELASLASLADPALPEKLSLASRKQELTSLDLSSSQAQLLEAQASLAKAAKGAAEKDEEVTKAGEKLREAKNELERAMERIEELKREKNGREEEGKIQREEEIRKREEKIEEQKGEIENFKEAVAKLTASLKTSSGSITKLRADRANIEAYTKQTITRFQDKYLVALQGCRQKVKDERARAEQLEERMERDKASQKREERLLSATVYELGLRIMSERVKS